MICCHDHSFRVDVEIGSLPPACLVCGINEEHKTTAAGVYCMWTITRWRGAVMNSYLVGLVELTSAFHALGAMNAIYR
jgi:hypothetical protein